MNVFIGNSNHSADNSYVCESLPVLGSPLLQSTIDEQVVLTSEQFGMYILGAR